MVRHARGLGRSPNTLPTIKVATCCPPVKMETAISTMPAKRVTECNGFRVAARSATRVSNVSQAIRVAGCLRRSRQNSISRVGAAHASLAGARGETEARARPVAHRNAAARMMDFRQGAFLAEVWGYDVVRLIQRLARRRATWLPPREGCRRLPCSGSRQAESVNCRVKREIHL